MTQVATPLRTPSLARRVVITALVLLTLLLVVMGVLLDTVLSSRLDAQLRDRLLDRATFARVLTEDLGDQADVADLARRLEGEDISVRVTDRDGSVGTGGRLPGGPRGRSAATPQPVPSRAPEVRAAPGPGERPRPTPRAPAAQDDDVVEFGSALTVREQVDGVVIDLYADRTAVDRVLAQVRLAMVVSGLVVLAVAALLIGPVTRRALRPLGTITDLALAIGSGDRGRRLRPDRPRTELGRTAAAFDDMLDAVEGAEGQARASEERLRDFVSDAAHELRTPVTGIRATAEHLLRAGSDVAPADREQLLLTLVRESGRAGRLVDDLLLMARIDRGLDVDRRRVDLLELAEQVADARRQAHPGLDLVVSGRPTMVEADPDRIQQVLTNLVDNAAQSTGGGGSVRIDVEAAGGVARVDVADDGPGVPAADRERIFERLVRLDDARQRRTGGAGLGLPIARGIARIHGGDLLLVDPRHEQAHDGRAQPGGATFRLMLPEAGVEAG